jgi:hypothetical protein
LVTWAALPISDDTYLVEKHTLRFVVSDRDLVGGRDLVGSHPKAETSVPLILADPDYDAAVVAVHPDPPGARSANDSALPRSRGPHNGSWSRLPGTVAEAKAIVPNIEAWAKTKPPRLPPGASDRDSLQGGRPTPGRGLEYARVIPGTLSG